MEDYCHSFEHTAELQLIFLQHALGRMCGYCRFCAGPLRVAWSAGGRPEDDDQVKRVIEALGELREREGDRLFWILGVDMAHMGARYHDQFTAVAGQGIMSEVGARDEERIATHRGFGRGGVWSCAREPRTTI